MKTFKRIWFLVLLLLLFLPMTQTCFHWVDEKPLGGAFVAAKKPVVNLNTLYNETAQDSLTRWCTEQTGFHKSLIRLNNQLLYSAFGKIPVTSLVKGNDGSNFFDKAYIFSYTGETYIGKEKIDATTHQLKVIQDMLDTKGVTLLPIFVVGKASYYPELIPEELMAKRHETNNYKEYLKAFEEQGVEMIDFNRWFCDRKDSEPHPLYCNLSSHWTVYGATLAIDSLVRYMESKTLQTQTHVTITGFDSTYLMEQDDELYHLMNLIFPIKHNTIDQPEFSFTQGYKPRVLSISDSYWWAIYAWDVALHQNLFTEGGFWFYNKTVYPKQEPIQTVEALNYKQEIEKQEFVLLVCTEATNHLWPYGFIERYLSSYENVYRYKQPEQYDAADSIYTNYRNERIDRIIQHIKKTPEWFEGVERQANEKGITLEKSLWDAAEYTYQTNIQPNGFVR